VEVRWRGGGGGGEVEGLEGSARREGKGRAGEGREGKAGERGSGPGRETCPSAWIECGAAASADLLKTGTNGVMSSSHSASDPSARSAGACLGAIRACAAQCACAWVSGRDGGRGQAPSGGRTAWSAARSGPCAPSCLPRPAPTRARARSAWGRARARASVCVGVVRVRVRVCACVRVLVHGCVCLCVHVVRVRRGGGCGGMSEPEPTRAWPSPCSAHTRAAATCVRRRNRSAQTPAAGRYPPGHIKHWTGRPTAPRGCGYPCAKPRTHAHTSSARACMLSCTRGSARRSQEPRSAAGLRGNGPKRERA
jgi:hypothetical protein